MEKQEEKWVLLEKAIFDEDENGNEWECSLTEQEKLEIKLLHNV